MLIVPALFVSTASPVATSDSPQVLSVTELTRGLSDLVEAHYDDVWVEGELSDFTRAASGHCYFTLTEAPDAVRLL
ncbi:MAG: hypothetical protein BRD26_02165 [Bacteroidetes bacterium QH_1_64_81]|nr:MAG: hypothetical protein BRD26_02165 [Bacteroidetes bacterium QH_1_64_81]